MSNVEETIARIYTINFSKAWLTPKHKRTDRVVNMIREFAVKHMKSSQIKIDQELNRYIWEKGKTHPPRKVRVRIVKDEDDQVIVSLYEDIVSETSTPALSTEEAPALSTEEAPALSTEEASEVKPDLAIESDNDDDSKKSILPDKKEAKKINNKKSKTKK
jgi:large subunit ribosomal protein L31e